MAKKKSPPSVIPPLHQSTEMVMACPVFYVEAFIKGNRKPGSLESARGREIHKVSAAYQSYCAQKQVKMDLAAFDELAKGAGPEAARILSGIRDSYEVDYAHLLATEVPMSLDAKFLPTLISDELDGSALEEESTRPSEYEGIPDAIYAYVDEKWILVPDWKSHPRPFDPDDTLQAKMYSLFIFQHFPWADRVMFRLHFVRYRKLSREIEFHRKQVPALIEAVRAARERQKMLHVLYDKGAQMEAIPGTHCQYCPLLANRTCPIAEYNEQMQLTPEEWVKWALWHSMFSRINNARMKARVEATGRPILIRDYNGKAYKYGPEESEGTSYPLFQMDADGRNLGRDDQGRILMPIVDRLLDWVLDEENGDPKDAFWYGNLEIGATELNGKLKATKRAILHQSIVDLAVPVPKVKFKVSKPLETIEDEEPEDDEESNGQ